MIRKGMMIFALSSALAMGTFTISSLAAEGWAQANGNWVYYTSSGSKVTNEWRKGADNLWRYLNSSGEMAINSWVDNHTYYVDANGILITDKWSKLPESSNSNAEYVWYYFGSSGKVISDTWKKIDNKWYYFDDDGRMQTGWILDDEYYTGSDGAMRTGWQRLVPPDEDDYDDSISPSSDGSSNSADDGKYWYYFASNGKKFAPDLSGADYGDKKIDGEYYCFDENGMMQTGWRNVKSSEDDNSAPISDFKYYGSDGKAVTGWLSAEPPERISGQYDHSVEWFYFNKNGTPEVGKPDGESVSSDLQKINGKTYLFNDKGNPVYGLRRMNTNNSGTSYTAYYFGDRNTSTMQKGKIKIRESGGQTCEYYFAESGRGYTGVKDNYLYYMGKLQKAESNTRYQPISIPSGNGYNTYVVSTSGKVAKSTTVKDKDGTKYKTNGSGILTSIDDENPGSGSYVDPEEPDWSSE